MTTGYAFRGLLSRILAAALLFSYLITSFPAAALASESETTPETTEACLAETVPAETSCPATVPEETVPEETSPQEPSVPETLPEEPVPEETVLETVPEETEAETPTVLQTLPPETEPVTLPEETQADTPAVLQTTLASIRFVKTCKPGTEGLTIQGTVVYTDSDMVVLQDSSGGLPVEPITDIALGDVLQITGTAGTPFAVASFEVVGTKDLPCSQTTLDALRPVMEYTRVFLANALLGEDSLTQGEVTLPLTATLPEGIAPGDWVDVYGIYTGDQLLAESISLTSTPAPVCGIVTATPEGGIVARDSRITLHCDTEGASIYYAIFPESDESPDFSLYSGSIPVPEDLEAFTLRAYAEKEGWLPGAETDFRFTVAPDEEPEDPTQWHFYFGLLHAHREPHNISPEEVFAQAAEIENLDFFALTDHDHFLDSAENGHQQWAQGKAAAEEATTKKFVGIYGYEFSWGSDQHLGHISTFNTPGWISSKQANVKTLEGYYTALASAPGSISQFCHPDPGAGNFLNFTHYRPEYDAAIQLLELTEENGSLSCKEYVRALDKGWHVAPSLNAQGLDGDARTVILSHSLTENAVYDAIRNCRVYASEDPDLEILYEMDGHLMGSVLQCPGKNITVTIQDPTDDTIGKLEVLPASKESPGPWNISDTSAQLTIPVSGESPYYFLRITQPDGDQAVTAPIWVDTFEDMSISAFHADPEVPTRGQSTTFHVEFSNEETADMTLTSLTVTLDGKVIHTAAAPITVPAAGSFTYSFAYIHDALGAAGFQVQAEGIIGDLTRTLESEVLTLRYQPDAAEEPILLSKIGDIRNTDTIGKIVLVKGHATSGTSNPATTFPNTIYLQDKTGGIAVIDFSDTGIQVGTPMEVTGLLTVRDGNYVLELIDYELCEEAMYRYDPETSYHRTAGDYATHGGELLQVEGEVVSLTRTDDRKGISRCILRDLRGDLITVYIEDTIFSASSGKNTLAEQVRLGRTVRARGLLHMHNGAAVIRVRNCDEVVYVPPVPDPTNPKTGDSIYLPITVMTLSGASLLLLLLFRKRTK